MNEIFFIQVGDTWHYNTRENLESLGLSEAQVLEASKNWAKNKAHSNRKVKETSMATWSGLPVLIDYVSQLKLTAAYSLAKNNNWVSGAKWFFGDGLARGLTPSDVIDMSLAAANYVQTSFEIESSKVDIIDACTSVEQVLALDLTI